jgi:hypothetical protein
LNAFFASISRFSIVDGLGFRFDHLPLALFISELLLDYKGVCVRRKNGPKGVFTPTLGFGLRAYSNRLGFDSWLHFSSLRLNS